MRRNARSTPSVFFTCSSIGGRRVTLSGELDVAALPELRTAPLPLTDTAGDGVLDISDMTFVDAAGLGVIVTLAAVLASRGSRLAVETATAAVRRVFVTARLHDLLESP